MSEDIKSKDTIKASGLRSLQRNFSNLSSARGKDAVNRGAITDSVVNDSIIYCARSFSADETITRDIIYETTYYPETINGPFWGLEPTHSGGTITDLLDVTCHAQERLSWGLIHSCSSKDYAEVSYDASLSPDPVAHKVDTSVATGVDNWSGRGAWGGGSGMFRKFGDKFFKIPNNGNDYTILFSTDINIGHACKNKSSIDDQKVFYWFSGMRFWTGVTYFLLPNKDSKRVLWWSPGHMIGASASVADFANRENTNRSINKTHSYTDVLSISNTFIRRLCASQGIDFDAHNMSLGDYSAFGWAVTGALDRWDYTDPLRDGFLTIPAGFADEDIIGLFEDRHGNSPPWREGQRVQVMGGNTSFIAFKDDANTDDSLDNNLTTGWKE